MAKTGTPNKAPGKPGRPANPTREELLSRVPPGATRIKVRDRHGQFCFRLLEPDEVLKTDVIVSNAKGQPITWAGAPGRPTKEQEPIKPANLDEQAIKQKIEDLANNSVNQFVADSVRKRHEGIASDPILTTAKNNPESSDLLHNVVIALAEEAASLGHERLEAETAGKETSQISTRRVQALKAVAETWLKRKDQISTKEIDLESIAFGALFDFILDTFRAAMDDSQLRPELQEMVVAKMTARMQDGWEVEAKNRMKQAK